MRDDMWQQEYQMGYQSFYLLCDLLQPYIQAQTTNWRRPIKVDLAVAAVLKRLASGMSNYDVASRYGIGKSTLDSYTLLIIDALSYSDKLFSRFINRPQGQRIIDMIRDFKDLTGIDQVCGAINGTHIKLHDKPKLRFVPADYWNRHDHHSVLL
jgi:predicted transcriptional regulator